MAAAKTNSALLQAAAVCVCVCVAVAVMQVVPAEASSELQEGSNLNPGDQLVQGPYSLTMQRDCNLVLYHEGVGALWTSNTFNMGTDCFFSMQYDGNAVVYTGSKTALFSTGTCCRNDGSHYIVLQSDGNVVMYNAEEVAIWATNTNGQ